MNPSPTHRLKSASETRRNAHNPVRIPVVRAGLPALQRSPRIAPGELSAERIAAWLPLFQKYGVAAYFCGHDHDLQHLEFEGVRTSFVVSGGGGASITKLKKPERKPCSETEYAAHFFHRHWRQSTYGFSHMLVTKDKLTLRHIDPAQKQLHDFTRNLAGKVEIIT